jgi:hypothetical protein
MADAKPERWIGMPVVIVYRYDDVNVWHQGTFGYGNAVGLKTVYAFNAFTENNRRMWQAIPDDSILTILPHPAVNSIVAIVDGEHAGQRGRVVDTHPPSASLRIAVDGAEVVSLPAAGVAFVERATQRRRL